MDPESVVSNIWSWDGWNVLGPVLLVLIPVLYVFCNRKIDDYRLILKNPDSRAQLARELAGGRGFRRYRAKIRRFSSGLQRWFGAPLSGRAFERCLQVALVYPIVLFIITWGAGGDGRISSMALFSPIENQWNRFGIAFVVFVIILSTGLYVSKIEKISGWMGGKIRCVLSYKEILPKIFVIAILNSINFGVVLFVAIFASVIAGTVAVVVVVVVAVVIIIVVIGASIGGGAGAVTVVAFGAGAVAIAAVNDSVVPAFILGTFLLALPLVNAGFDWLSWGATRYFLSRVAKVTGGYKAVLEISLDLVLDLIAAALCLVALAAALPNVIELMNYLIIGLDEAPIRWPDFVFAAINDPLGGGLMIWGMLISTLLPTLIHMTIGFKALSEALKPGDLKALLPADGQDWKDDQSRFRAADHLLYRLFWWVPAGLFSGFFVFVIFYGLYVFFDYFTWTLGAVAFCATSWKHGYCPLF